MYVNFIELGLERSMHTAKEFDIFREWLKKSVVALESDGVFITSNSRSEVRGISALLEKEGITHVLEPITAAQHGAYVFQLSGIPMDVMAITIPNPEDIAKFRDTGLADLPRNKVNSPTEALDMVFGQQR